MNQETKQYVIRPSVLKGKVKFEWCQKQRTAFVGSINYDSRASPFG